MLGEIVVMNFPIPHRFSSRNDQQHLCRDSVRDGLVCAAVTKMSSSGYWCVISARASPISERQMSTLMTLNEVSATRVELAQL